MQSARITLEEARHRFRITRLFCWRLQIWKTKPEMIAKAEELFLEAENADSHGLRFHIKEQAGLFYYRHRRWNEAESRLLGGKRSFNLVWSCSIPHNVVQSGQVPRMPNYCTGDY